jgi:hypothetical protein
MKTIAENVGLFLKSIWNGMLGIFTELAMTYFFIFAGFVVCVAWWFILFR